MNRMRIMYKVREKGTEKYISDKTSWAFVPADRAHFWKNEETVRNVIECNCPTHLKEKLEVVVVKDFSDDIAALDEMRPESLMNLIRYAYVIKEGIGQITETYSGKVSENDGIEQDILHAIEFSSGFSADEKVALFDRLKANRKARRENKDICQLLLAFKNGGNVAKVYDGLWERSYKPRQDGTLFQDEGKGA